MLQRHLYNKLATDLLPTIKSGQNPFTP